MRIVIGILGLIWKLYFFVIFTLTAIVMYPLITPLLTTTEKKKKAFKRFVLWSRILRYCTFYFIKVERREELPKGPFIILANHISYLDIFLMYSIFPHTPFLFLGKSELLSYPLLKTYFKKFNIPVDRKSRIRAARSLDHTRAEAAAGWSIAIFPEGKIPDHEHPKLVPFKMGAFILAKEMEMPIVNMTYLNNHILFSNPEELFGSARPGVSKVVIHPVIKKEEVMASEVKELRDRCFNLINEPLTRNRK